MIFPRVFCILLLMHGHALAAAEKALATIELHHRLPEEISPLIKPLLEEGDAVIPNRSSLIVRASPAKLAEINGLVQELDKKQHRLLITVAQGTGLSREILNARAGLQTQTDPSRPAAVKPSGSGHLYQTESRRMGDQIQRAQTLDGQPAHIHFGEQIPIPQGGVGYGYGGQIVANPGIQFRQVTTGFDVIPRVLGERVHLDIALWSDHSGRQGGGIIDTQSAHTTLTANLGEWVELGGQVSTQEQSAGGLLGHHYSTRSEAAKIFLKVEDLDGGQP